MKYTVKDLLESKQFPEMKLISGESELDREIKGARILEVPNMELFFERWRNFINKFENIRKCRVSRISRTFRGNFKKTY